MKKIVLILLMILCLAQHSNAQVDTLKSDDIEFKNVENDLMISISGYNVTFGGMDYKTTPYRGTLSFINRWELGFNFLLNADYSDYPQEMNDFMDLREGKSIHIGFNFATYMVALNKSRTVYAGVGTHLMCDNYTFGENITLQKIDGKIMPVDLLKKYKKSKLTAAYIGIPVYLNFKCRRAELSLNGYADFLINSHTKYKKPKEKDHLSGLNPVQLGVGATLSYAQLGIYAKYSASPLFKNSTGPDAHLFSFGFYCGF